MLKNLQKVNNNGICVKRNALCLNFSSYKTSEEKILNLVEPLKIQLVSINDRKKLLALDDDIGFKSGTEASLNSKTFKKNKRNEKDINEEESDKVKIKSKFKQK